MTEIRQSGASAGQNIGYQDKLKHKYWHYMDTAFPTPDGTPTEPADPVNGLTQIKLFKAALPSS
ncbi:MAG: S1/P1 nuclease, partial [Methyloceanibacter sp.]